MLVGYENNNKFHVIQSFLTEQFSFESLNSIHHTH